MQIHKSYKPLTIVNNHEGVDTMKYIMILLLIVVLAGCTMTSTQKINEMQQDSTPSNPVISTQTDNEVQQDPGTSNPAVKTFSLEGKNFRFSMNGQETPDITVKQGDRVRIEFTSTDGFHDWVVDEFNAKTAQVQTGGTTSVEFTADQKGTFEYYCSVGQHRQNGMKGKLIVE